MKHNPSEFYGLFKRCSRTPSTDLTLNDFYNNFKELGTNKNANDYIEISNVEECVYQELDYPITEKEVQAVIANLKSKMSAGKDNLLNEYFITFKEVFVPLLVSLFNVIFDNGNFPSILTEGIIIPLFKKGHANDANNYRGITLISCLEKIFTSVKWSDKNSIVTDAQFGFKPGYGTTDAIFSLHTVISKVLSSKKKLYCCFVNYRKAFDSVNRYKLLFKLARSGITGKLYGIIKSMYESLKSSVKFQCQFSQFFDCNVS